MLSTLMDLHWGAGGERDQFKVLIVHVYSPVEVYQFDITGILTTDILT